MGIAMQRKKVHNVHINRKALHSSTQTEPTHSCFIVLTNFCLFPSFRRLEGAYYPDLGHKISRCRQMKQEMLAHY